MNPSNNLNYSSYNFEEELDYEYSDEDDEVSSCYGESSTLQTESHVSLSPTNDNIDKQTSIKLRRHLPNVEDCQCRSDSPRKWKVKMSLKGWLKRWRIRSLDNIFTPRTAVTIQKHKIKKNKRINAVCEQKLPDDISDFSIIINNDLCSMAAVKPEYCLCKFKSNKFLVSPLTKSSCCDIKKNESSCPSVT